WQTMYDYPSFRLPRQHLPISDVWDPCRIRSEITNNNRNADDAITLLLYRLDPNPQTAANYKSHPPPLEDTAAREKLGNDLVQQAIGMVGDPASIQMNTLSAEDQRFVNSILALQTALQQGKLLEAQLQTVEKQLHAELSGKAVLIGFVATSANDSRPTPLTAQCPGVVVHGAVFNAILSRFTLERLGPWASWSMTLLIGMCATAAGIWLPPWKGLLATAALVAAFLLFNGELLYDRVHLVAPLAGPIVAAAAVWFALVLLRFIAEQVARARVIERFSSYVDPAIVKYVIDNPEKIRLEGEVKELTVVFTDLAGFSTLAEKLQERSIQVLNRYFDVMTRVIRAHGGTVNKFLGDGIMFFYGAPIENPHHADDAVITVLKMHEALIGFNQTLQEAGFPSLGMRAGVSTGKMVVGDAGGASACDYTVLGDLVNLGSRLESANKQFGSRMLIGEKTALKIVGRFLMRPIGRIQVKGKTKVVMTYEVLAKIDEAAQRQKDLTDMTEAMVDAFISSEFSQCIAAADALDAAFGASPLSQLYRSLSQMYLKNPPDFFDGSIVLETK
ncbi:MAG TPA: adenylate/guanylate cyclase domain-containing protein, partial [Tepidisphaeraceae bacterium]|nr:adenylate/guanylate cyclase domain-containing protein [Tepidisphaeraceae bacterium]